MGRLDERDAVPQLEKAGPIHSAHTTGGIVAECWELLERVTGPAYAGGDESKQWNWVHDGADGPSPSEDATRALIEAVTIAAECWDKLAIETIDDLRSPASVVRSCFVLSEPSVSSNRGRH